MLQGNFDTILVFTDTRNTFSVVGFLANSNTISRLSCSSKKDKASSSGNFSQDTLHCLFFPYLDQSERPLQTGRNHPPSRVEQGAILLATAEEINHALTSVHNSP